jgi:hypothetical protein
MTISKELLDELLKGVERPEDLLGEAGLMKELKIKLMERMPAAAFRGLTRSICRSRDSKRLSATTAPTGASHWKASKASI